MTQPLRRLPGEGVTNCRDLGGYPCADGSVTRFGRLYRFGLPKQATQADIRLFRELGIRRILDLRSSFEIKRGGSVFASLSDFAYQATPLYKVNPTFIRKSKELWNIYQLSVDLFQEQYRLAFSFLLSCDGPAAFHCHAGKDRTGILSALLLELAGVGREDIIADYEVSSVYIAQYYESIPKKRFQLVNRDKYLPSPPELMERFLDYMQTQYGGALGYVRQLGLAPQEVARLQGLLKE